MKKDIYGKILNIGDKVHPPGKANRIYYIIELGDKVAGISSDKNSKNCMGVLYEKIVKFKNQT